jgi:anti-sigma-K factor RskA
MTSPMREHLIGYLLDAVEPHERAAVEEYLQRDESLRRELDLCRKGLEPLACDADHHEPPPGLAQRCCQYVYSRIELIPAALSPAAGASSGSRRWSWLDLSVAGAIAAAVAVLMVPAIYNSRIQAQLRAAPRTCRMWAARWRATAIDTTAISP